MIFDRSAASGDDRSFFVRIKRLEWKACESTAPARRQEQD
jgi:hypothetical protein